ncbi:MAG: TonB-dependent receptor [Rhodanobacteraceae bacterium]|jgi:iron complex outermembrane receptor protein|nr:TonB-dependent receptor [Rhodanobacteraceae bacterium]
MFKPSIKGISGCLLACALGHPGSAQAEDGAVRSGPDAPVTLDTVAVAASLNQTAVEEMPLHTTIISRDDILKSPAQTLDQLLRTIPGFNFTGIPAAISDPTGQQTRMRGLGNAKVLVLLDGIPLVDPFYLTTQFYKAPLSGIDHIEVIRGGTSSLWGTMAVAGLVNIVTRPPADNSGVVTIGGGSQGTANIAWSQSIKVTDTFALNLSANQYRTDGYITTPAQYRWKFPGLEANSARDTNVVLSAFFRFSDDLNGFVRVGHHRQDQHIGYTWGRNLQDNPDVALGLDEKLGGRDSLSWRAWAQWVHFTKFNGATCYYQLAGGCLNSNAPNQIVSDDVVEYYSQHGDQRYREQGTSLIHSAFFDGFLDSLQIGVNYRRLAAKDAEQFYSTPSSPAQPQVLNATGYGQGEQTFGGVFVQVKASPIDALQITASGRYDYWRNSDQLNTLAKASTGLVSGGALSPSTQTAFDPGVGLHYDLTAAWSLRAAAYKAFRAPGFNNITRSYGVGPTTVANPSLGPETMTGWEAGSDYRNERVSFGATWFHYDIRNMIATYRISSAAGAPGPVLALCSSSATTPDLANCGGSANYYTNDQNGASHGVELNASWDVASSLTLGAWFTYTDTYLTRAAAAITTPLHVQLVGVPKKMAALDATWKPTERVTAYAQIHYIGPLYLDETTTRGVYYGQGGNVVCNASVRYELTKAIDLSLDLVNAFDRTYSENAYTITQPWSRSLSMPRTWYASATFKY